MLNILKWVVPIFPAPGKVAGAYIKKLPEIRIKPDHVKHFQMEGLDDVIFTMEGAELRYIRQLLESIDKTHYWGGLEGVVTPEGHILWLCPEHAKEYK